jgi:protein TonB
MRRDFVLALMVSLLIHGGLAGLSEWLKQPAVRVTRDIIEVPLPPMPMPPLDPEPVDPPEKREELTPVADFSPPILPDVPLPPQPDSFVQPLEPPPLDNVRPDVVVIIPPGRVGPRPITEIFNPATLDQQPIATYQAKPVYPFERRHEGLTGGVVVGFVVDAAGSVQNAYVVSSTDNAFEASALQAVARWKFKPGRKGGRAVSTRMQVPILFHIADDEG